MQVPSCETTWVSKLQPLFAVLLLTTASTSSTMIVWIMTLVQEVGVALCVWQPSGVVAHDLHFNDACFIVDTHWLVVPVVNFLRKIGRLQINFTLYGRRGEGPPRLLKKIYKWISLIQNLTPPCLLDHLVKFMRLIIYIPSGRFHSAQESNHALESKLSPK